MKLKSSDQNQPFNPVTFEITVESEAELVALWAALNASNDGLRANVREHPGMQKILNTSSDCESCFELFQIVDDALVARGLKK